MTDNKYVVILANTMKLIFGDQGSSKTTYNILSNTIIYKHKEIKLYENGERGYNIMTTQDYQDQLKDYSLFELRDICHMLIPFAHSGYGGHGSGYYGGINTLYNLEIITQYIDNDLYISTNKDSKDFYELTEKYNKLEYEYNELKKTLDSIKMFVYRET